MKRQHLIFILDNFVCRSTNAIARYCRQELGINYLTHGEVERTLASVRKDYRNGKINFTVPHVGGPFHLRHYRVDRFEQRLDYIELKSTLTGNINTEKQAYIQLKHQLRLKETQLERGDFPKDQALTYRRELFRREMLLDELERSMERTALLIGDHRE